MINSILESVIQTLTQTLKANDNQLNRKVKEVSEAVVLADRAVKKLIDYTPMIDFEVISTQLSPNPIPLEDE